MKQDLDSAGSIDFRLCDNFLILELPLFDGTVASGGWSTMPLIVVEDSKDWVMYISIKIYCQEIYLPQ